MAENKSLQEEPTFPAKRKSNLDVQLETPIKAPKLKEKIAVENGESATKPNLNGVVTVPEEANGGEKGIDAAEEDGVAKIRKIDCKSKGIMLEEENGVYDLRDQISGGARNVLKDMKSSSKENRAEKQMNEEGELYTRGMSKIGSSSPSCKHKFYGCTPCEAIQVPTTTSRSSRVRVQYTNYEPEGWKCKCGPFFYSP